MNKLVVMKFGGTSVGNAERIRNVAEIVALEPKGKIVVVSAMAGVTDMLIKASQLAAKQKSLDLNELLSEIRNKHFEAINDLKLSKPEKQGVVSTIQQRLAELETAVAQVLAIGDCSREDYDRIVSFGERLSIQLVSAAIRAKGIPSTPVESSKIIITSNNHGDAEPILDESVENAKAELIPLVEKEGVPVVTGFIGSTRDGNITTLGRGASDYTATILGYCLDADEVWIWTDVTGVMTADPRLIPEAKTIDSLSYQEAAELSYFGAKVLHPLTMVPASLKDIPIFIKNTFEPSEMGTKITSDTNGRGVKAITVKNDLSLVTVRGKGVIGVPHVTAKVFGALADESIDVFMISQASAEHNISFIIRGDRGAKAVEQVHGALVDEMSSKNVEFVQLKNGVAIVAVVGDGMQNLPGITEQTFSSLGASGINIIAIAYGSSEHSISFVVEAADSVTALKSLHQTFQLIERG